MSATKQNEGKKPSMKVTQGKDGETKITSVHEFKIETGIPMPAFNISKDIGLPFDKMKAGDSFLFDKEYSKNAHYRFLGRYRNYKKQYSDQNPGGDPGVFKASEFTEPDKSKSCRVWCIIPAKKKEEDNQPKLAFPGIEQ